ncbi:glycosyltransferase [Kitasatospora sp. NPDC097643]|uniref:glycosyltransferase n=1 Tax=Kitasatospora sp. NPDC097643 TaxID=3157230 RepID=UPI00331BAC43
MTKSTTTEVDGVRTDRMPPVETGVRPARPSVRTVVARAALPVAMVLWLLSLRRVHLELMDDLGLIEVLPVLFWVALGVLTLGFACHLRGPRLSHAWSAAYVIGLIAIVHATPSLLYPTVRYSWAWKHVEVVDAMLRHGGTVPRPGWLDIYNQWPGFFTVNGLLLRTTGLHSAMGYAHWATPVADVLLIGPLLLVYRTISRDWRLIWGAVWIFFSCLWIGQDYFAPQTFGFLLFVTVLALVLKQLPRVRPPGAHPAPQLVPAAVSPGGTDGGGTAGREGWRPALFLMVVLCEGVLITSHQLTPLMLIAFLTALSIPRRNRRVVLPVLACAVVMQAVWFATVARPFISANLRNFIAAITSPDSNAPTWLTGLGSPAPGQILLAWVDRGLSAAVVLLAAIALWRRPWTRRTPLPLLLLAPLPMPALNSYGGEMIFRSYLFALPAAALLVAALVLRTGPPVRVRAVASFALLLAFLGGLVFGYYGKEMMESFTAREAAATEFLYRTAPAGSMIVSVTNNVPDIDKDYDRHTRVVIAWNLLANRQLLLKNPLAGVEDAVSLAAPPGPVYLILNRAQAAECYITGVLPADTVDRLATAVDSSRLFTPVFRNSDAVVYVLSDRNAPEIQPHPRPPQHAVQQQGGRP